METQVKPLTIGEVAAHFRVNERTVRRWINRGCPAMRPSEGIIRFDLDEVTRWCNEGVGAPKSAAACIGEEE